MIDIIKSIGYFSQTPSWQNTYGEGFALQTCYIVLPSIFLLFLSLYHIKPKSSSSSIIAFSMWTFQTWFLPLTGIAGGTSAFSFLLLPFLGCSGAKLVTLVTVSPELQKKKALKSESGMFQRKGMSRTVSRHFLCKMRLLTTGKGSSMLSP